MPLSLSHVSSEVTVHVNAYFLSPLSLTDGNPSLSLSSIASSSPSFSLPRKPWNGVAEFLLCQELKELLMPYLRWDFRKSTQASSG